MCILGDQSAIDYYLQTLTFKKQSIFEAIPFLMAKASQNQPYGKTPPPRWDPGGCFQHHHHFLFRKFLNMQTLIIWATVLVFLNDKTAQLLLMEKFLAMDQVSVSNLQCRIESKFVLFQQGISPAKLSCIVWDKCLDSFHQLYQTSFHVGS